MSVIGAGMALGALHASVIFVVAIVAGAAAFLCWWGAERVLVRPAATALVLLGAGLTFYTFLQVVPLPAFVVVAVAPHTADIWSRALAPLREPGPSWVSLSLDPIATRVEVVRGAAYLATFLAALKISSRRDGGRFLAFVLIAAGLFMAVAAIVHPAVGLAKVYGFLDPGPGVDPRHIAPLLNPNHLAAHLNIAFAVALAAAVAREPSVPRWFAIVAALVLAGTQLWAASRGGVLAMVASTVLVLWMSRARVADARATLTRTLPLLGIALLSLAMVVFGASREAALELASTDASKIGAIREMSRMLPSYWKFGAGRGAFESTFPEFRDGSTHAVFTHPETILVQWTAEWGIPVALAAGAVLLVALWPRASVARSPAAVGAWVALVAAGAHNLVDFNSETPGVVIPLAVCAAIVVGGAPDHAPRSRLGRWSLRPHVPAVGIAAVTLVALGLGALSIGHGLVDDREAVRKLALAPATSLDAMHATARAAMLRHPAEPYLPYAVALRAGRAQDESVVPWLARVFERAPVYAPAHLLLARSLVRISPAQARLEYRLSIEQEPNMLQFVVKEAPQLVTNVDDALELLPHGVDELRMLDRLIDELADRLPATAFALNALLLERAPNDPSALTRAARGMVAELEAMDAAPWCFEPTARKSCIERAIAITKSLQRVVPNRCVGFDLESRARVAGGEGVGGLVVLREAAPRVEDRAACQRGLVTLAAKTGDPGAVTAAVDELVHAGCESDNECVANLFFAASIEEQRGNSHRALALYKRARDREPDNDVIQARICALASAMGMHAEAMQCYQVLQRRHPDVAQWARAASAEREALVSSPPRL